MNNQLDCASLIERTRPVICADERTCPKCQASFQPKRKNQYYCSTKCQKNASRGSRETYKSPSQRYDNHRDWHLLHWLNETYYGTPPRDRLGLIKDWLDAARAGDTRLRRVLANPTFRQGHRDERNIYFRRCWAYSPVPLVADVFCLRLRNCRVWEWVNGTATEPETGEVTYNPPPAYEVAAGPSGAESSP